MNRIIYLIIILGFYTQGFGQNFKYIKPILDDSTKVIQSTYDSLNMFERLYYIDYKVNSSLKSELLNFKISKSNPIKSVTHTYYGILENEKNIISKVSSSLPEKWVKIFKYKGELVLFNDIPKYLLMDSCLVVFDMDDPSASVVNGLDFKNNIYRYELLSYNWSDPKSNIRYSVEIKILDSNKMIALWKFNYQDQIHYELLVPDIEVRKFPIVGMLTTDFMGDETDIFDRIDYEKLWKK